MASPRALPEAERSALTSALLAFPGFLERKWEVSAASFCTERGRGVARGETGSRRGVCEREACVCYAPRPLRNCAGGKDGLRRGIAAPEGWGLAMCSALRPQRGSGRPRVYLYPIPLPFNFGYSLSPH
ncbi:transcription termination factor 1, mitochondrial isoform X2 [Mesocricetus auratus]|uniref:Transcription termination factor 1, mitochondrial isoform X2 n=1 Tax=Mesocricetus auratus TaxID=10036 RepID=A0ABM2WSM3_MESAU|nr:transcription termination factor 1, mitochondrial isoform X2 [Mesocricetus auratus]XP_040591804.1 transcription termination factor 1, mitochondrial isoform X2 [Mesocricetus auratus]